MFRIGSLLLAAVAAGLFILLNWAFADGLFSLDNLWVTEAYAESTIWTYVLLGLIILAGVYQVLGPRPEAPTPPPERRPLAPGQTDDPALWKFLIGSTHFALFWLPVRFFVGREWLVAGEHKLRDSAWMDTGTALQSYWERVAAVPEEGRPVITYGWYRDLLQYMLDNEWYTWFGPLIAIGEFLVGAALVLGALVGIAAFFGTLLNFSFMLAGSASSNPVLFGLSIFLILAWKIAGFWGLDRWLLPMLGAPWAPGRLFTDEPDTPAASRAS